MTNEHPCIHLGTRWLRHERGVPDPKHVMVVIRTTPRTFFVKREGQFRSEATEWSSIDAFLMHHSPAPDTTIRQVHLAPGERKILGSLARLCARLGRAPTMRQIADDTGYKSVTTVERIMKRADLAGFTQRARGLGRELGQRELTPAGIAALRDEAMEAAE